MMVSSQFLSIVREDNRRLIKSLLVIGAEFNASRDEASEKMGRLWGERCNYFAQSRELHREAKKIRPRTDEETRRALKARAQVAHRSGVSAANQSDVLYARYCVLHARKLAVYNTIEMLDTWSELCGAKR